MSDDVRTQPEEAVPNVVDLSKAPGSDVRPPRPIRTFTDGEAYLRLGYPDGLETDGTQPTTCSPIEADSAVPHNPLTEKGKEIMGAMDKEYGPKKGKKVFYASRNKGNIKGVD